MPKLYHSCRTPALWLRGSVFEYPPDAGLFSLLFFHYLSLSISSVSLMRSLMEEQHYWFFWKKIYAELCSLRLSRLNTQRQRKKYFLWCKIWQRNEFRAVLLLNRLNNHSKDLVEQKPILHKARFWSLPQSNERTSKL